MNGRDRPHRRDDLIFRQLEGDFVIYDPVSDRTILLNVTAALVFDLCDGTRTMDEIASSVAETFAMESNETAADTTSIVEEFARQGLLAGQASDDEPPATGT